MIVTNNDKQLNHILSLISRIIGKEPDETVLEITYQKQKRMHSVFEISNKEIEAVKKKDNIEDATRDIILEKMALLSTKS